ncbi:adhesion G protein-coupled receptor E1 isoform X6 [Prionailurus viverrinus]|uniref:adhesion G protein-coupled receptor E1 isoform X6 n=1 Tax=Prionailurus viverrinus TaxID=61388 RepID=UPI001FF6E35F|nr:adhesion G protein-coupled receptor E1 isoform X6 [Prionailurus viverrinus]
MWSFSLLLFWGCCGLYSSRILSTRSATIGVNECEDTTVCPAYATCTNTLDSYYCTCKGGFLSSNGLTRFRGPEVTCKDVDECSQSPQPCGANSVCKNLQGRYKCSCLPGFSSPTGNDWTSGKPGHFSCTDINECLSNGVCPEHAECINSLGSYNCSCQVGFISHNSICEDVDECADPATCPEHATCHNSPGSYSCVCNLGFASSSGNRSLQGPGDTCEDVDECARNSTLCGLSSVCTNTPGEYHCSCLPGFFSPVDWTPEKPEDFRCTDVDECSQSPQPCGANSACKNLQGRYKCSCLPGFSSPTGNDWTPGKPGHFSCTDVDECADPATCPEHATCHNSPGSYSCVCNLGFASSSGNRSLQGPGDTCEDVDECARNSTLCGLSSVCTNTPGEYHCSCLPGFFSPVDWTPEKPEDFRCTDVDECADPATCPEHATCHNSPGSYSCVCNLGFESSSGNRSLQGPGDTCEDIDECLYISLSNATCTNTPGSYFCTCSPGFAPSNGQLNFTGQDVECRDIDECSQDPSPCGPSSVCTNAPGSYSCSCIEGFRPHPEGSFNFNCKRIPFKCKEDVIPNNEWVQQCQVGEAVMAEYGSFCTLMNATFSVLDNACENKTTVVSLKSAAESLTSVLEQTSTWSNFSQEETSALATVILESVKSSTLAAFLEPSANVTQTVQTEHLEIESKIIQGECAEENMILHFKAKGNEMKIQCSTIKESESIGNITGTIGVAFVSFSGMELFLDESFFQDPQNPLANSQRRLRMNSHVVQGIMTGEKQDGFSNPVIYTLENIEPRQTFESPICVSWNTDMEGGRWIPSGCKIHEVSEMYTTCSCHHMMNLAVIMASGELTTELPLYIISHVGLIISLVCLVLAIATFLLCRAIHNHNTYLHLHLCVCLFLAKTLFLTGVDKTDNQTGCAITAGFLHYLFLACFFWMLVEAVMLFLMVRNLKVMNYFSSRNIKMWYLCAFGYGLPGLVVAVSAGVQPQGYGMRNRCWLNTERGFVWSFLGPVCAIILINSILLTCTLCILRQKLSSVNAEVSTLKDTRLLTFKAFAQLFILGCSWVLGIFQIGSMASIMAYLFTIINSLQGTFIFIIHCLLNRQVREEYRKCITRKTKRSPESQTSGMLLSSVPSTSKSG